jgi:hypothetical protein
LVTREKGTHMAVRQREGAAERAQRLVAEAVGEALDGLDGITTALCAAAGVCGNELLGMRAYADRYVFVVADGRKLEVPAETVERYLECAAGTRS